MRIIIDCLDYRGKPIETKHIAKSTLDIYSKNLTETLHKACYENSGLNIKKTNVQIKFEPDDA